MTVESPRIRSLLRQADSVAAAGKRAAAEQLYRQILEEAPDTAQAWRGLGHVARDKDDREAALARAMDLDPAYEAQGDAPTDAAVEASEQVTAERDNMDERSMPAASKDGQAKQGSLGEPSVAADDALARPSMHTHAEDEVPVVTTSTSDMAEALVCANHPGRQTHLRCNRCGKPICSSCANPTPVGYRCPECIREQEDVYFTATPIDYVIAVLVALPLSLVAGWLATLLGFWSIFLAAFAGTLIGRVSFRAARRRRGRWMPYVVAACVIIGGVLPALPLVLGIFFGQFSLRLLFTGIYIVMATGATYYQMR